MPSIIRVIAIVLITAWVLYSAIKDDEIRGRISFPLYFLSLLIMTFVEQASPYLRLGLSIAVYVVLYAMFTLFKRKYHANRNSESSDTTGENSPVVAKN